MKKHVLILPLMLLTACAEMTGDAYEEEENYEEEMYADNSGVVMEQSGLEWMEADVSPNQMGNVPNQTQVAVRPQPQQAQEPMRGGQPPVQQARISPDGTMIELPAQQIYLGTEPQAMNAPAGAVPAAAALPPMAYSAPSGVQPQPQQIPPAPVLPAGQPQRPPVVTLQNMAYPNTFAQCAASDVSCIASYEQQGYRRLNGAPQFAGYQDGLSHSDYPQDGRWRNGNNIPRW